ncbi:MAG TPA: tetratricopeptide repeat protein [Gemmatimonadaceae bacterium]
MLVSGKGALSALMIATFGAAAGAQQKACEIDEGQPGQVARAMLYLQMTQSASNPDAAAKPLRDATKVLDEADKTKNPVGQAFVKGKILVSWMAQPSMASGVATRSALGFVTNPTGSYDLVAGIDSAFSVVEASNPDCASQTTGWRQQKGWVDLVNRAIELGNQSDKADSAVLIAKRSLMMYKGAPYGYMVLAKAAAEKNQSKEAIDYYKQAVSVTSKDTSTQTADLRRQVLLQLANYSADLYEQGTGDKAAMLAEAKAAYEALAKDPGTKYADAARGGQARLAQMSGDTTAIRATYADQLANPGAFSYASLMNAAVTAARASQTKDAIKLFEAARTMNPSHRDVLYNLSRLYLLDSAYVQALPHARQLVAVDPSNPDNYQLIAIAYASMQKGYATKVNELEGKSKAYGQKANAPRVTAAVQKANIDSAARLAPVIKAYTDSSARLVDSAVKYNEMMTKLPAKVSFSEFTPTEAKTTLGGTITNNTEAARSFTFKVEFVDKTGAVVNTQDVTVGPVQPQKSATFSATGTGAGIIAFRYTPIT